MEYAGVIAWSVGVAGVHRHDKTLGIRQPSAIPSQACIFCQLPNVTVEKSSSNAEWIRFGYLGVARSSGAIPPSNLSSALSQSLVQFRVFLRATFLLLRLLERGALGEPHSVLVYKRPTEIGRIHGHRQRKARADEHVRSTGREANLLATSPPVVDGSDESHVVEQSVYRADLRLLRLESIALNYRRKLGHASHYSWEGGEDRDDGAVV